MAKTAAVKKASFSETKKKSGSVVSRIIIDKVSPQIDGGKFPIKRVVGERVVVRADVFGDGHDEVSARLLYREASASEWSEAPMKDLGNDLWIGHFAVEKNTTYVYTVRGFANEFGSWCHDLKKRVDAGRDVAVDIEIGRALVKEASERAKGVDAELLEAMAAQLDPKNVKTALVVAFSDELMRLMNANLDIKKSATYAPELSVTVDRERARFSSWYEFFPRSWGKTAGVHGTFKDCERILPEIAKMGFDVIYLPPIHPIGMSFRKGKNNATTFTPGEPGCPWAVGAPTGGHKAVHPDLGTLDDFRAFMKKAEENKMEVALDIAFQCSPDHPYLKQHPDWFKWRPDGTVQYAENPPKKYEDIVPFNFDTDDREGLWEELKSIVLFWVDQGVKIFRVDNPHTKAFLFWDWMIAGVQKDHPDVIFLAEAFTRPKVMYRLAKGGFTQSYTYFTWRNTKRDFEEYLTELAQTEAAEFFRPNFWPNTPDILPEQLQFAGRPAFAMRAVMAATLSSNFGVYGPAFELCVTQGLTGKEEYFDSEKYEIKAWDWNKPGNIKDLVTKLNKIRHDNAALQMTRNIRFCRVDNDQLLAYYKATGDYSNIVLTVVNLDPYNAQAGWLNVPLHELGISKDRPYKAEDLLSGEKHVWQGERIHLSLDPHRTPAHVVLLSKELRREETFDYFM